MLIYRSKNRGCKELDIILTSFVENNIYFFSIQELIVYQEILNIDDVVLYRYIVDKDDDNIYKEDIKEAIKYSKVGLDILQKMRNFLKSN